MRFSRDQNPPVTSSDGIAFCLGGQGAKLHCTITRAALILLAGRTLLERDYRGIFEEHRDTIEEATFHKHQDRRAKGIWVTLTAYDLEQYLVRDNATENA